VVVVCNGCTDDTAEIARRFGQTTRVIESRSRVKLKPSTSVIRSLRLLRIYADADIVITVDAIRALTRRSSEATCWLWHRRRYQFNGLLLAGASIHDIRSRLPFSARELVGPESMLYPRRDASALPDFQT